MDEQLDRVRKAYDLTVKQYRNGIDPLGNLPDEIKNSPFFKSLAVEKDFLNSAAADVREYLTPQSGMRFLDAGCSANLVNYRLDGWPSAYYGVDISPALIGAMREFVEREKIKIGGLEVTDISNLPFDDNFFDIAAVIGVLEYCTLEYIGKALAELHRVLRSGAPAVLDIPNRDHPHTGYMQKLEEYLERPIFIHPRADFEALLTPLFLTDHIDDSRVMLKYFLRTA
jgi:SAM-dependent methyltransferase